MLFPPKLNGDAVLPALKLAGGALLVLLPKANGLVGFASDAGLFAGLKENPEVTPVVTLPEGLPKAKPFPAAVVVGTKLKLAAGALVTESPGLPNVGAMAFVLGAPNVNGNWEADTGAVTVVVGVGTVAFVPAPPNAKGEDVVVPPCVLATVVTENSFVAAGPVVAAG